MKLNKHTIKTMKGKGICYRLSDFRFDAADNKVKWEAFRFYTPIGPIANGDGRRFFNVMGGQVPLTRDKEKDKRIVVKISLSRGTQYFEFYGEEKNDVAQHGLGGDVAVICYIPADPRQEITTDYKEVLWE